MIYVGDRCVNINSFTRIPRNSWIVHYNDDVVDESNWPTLNVIVDEIQLSDYSIGDEYDQKVGYLIGRQAASTTIYTVANEVYVFSDGTVTTGIGNNNVTHTWNDAVEQNEYPDRWVIVFSNNEFCKGQPDPTYCYWVTGGAAFRQNQAKVNAANYPGYRQNNTPFRQRSCLKHIENLNLLVGQNANHAFRDNPVLEDFVNCTWYTSDCASFQDMFNNSKKLKSVDMSGADSSNCVTTQNMFSGCNSLTSVNMSTWNMNACTNIQSMFYNCNSLISVDTSRWNLSACTNAQAMFYNCNNLISIDTSNYDLRSCTTTQAMFQSCRSLSTVDMFDWNLSSCSLMQMMFCDCQSLISVDTSRWDVKSCINASQMFQQCNSLISIDTSNWNLSSCTSINSMFLNCYRLATIGSTKNWNTSKITNMGSMFTRCYVLQELDIADWDFSSNTIMYEFLTDNVISSLCPSGWTAPMNLSSVTSYVRWMNMSHLVEMPPFTNVRPNMDVPLNSSPLSRDCVAVFNQAGDTIVGGIIYYLNNLTGQAKSTLRLSSTTKNYFTAEEKAIIEAACSSKNWTLAW